MISVGVEYEYLNCVGIKSFKKDCFDCNDVHEAAKQLFKMFHQYHSRYVLTFKSAEFHDVDNHKTWNVDETGKTQRNYHDERYQQFIFRWTGKTAQERYAEEKKQKMREAIAILSDHGFDCCIRNEETGHIQSKSRKQKYTFNYYAGTGSITALSKGYPKKGLNAFMNLLNEY